MKKSPTFQILTWLGILAMTVQAGSYSAYFVLFRLNQPAIARTVCERKQPNCNGKCYLTKQISRSEDDRNDRRTEQLESQLSVQFLPASERKLTRSESDHERPTPSSLGSTHDGWSPTFLPPPRVKAL